MAVRQVSKIFVASKVANIADILRQSLKEAGLGAVCVQQLTLSNNDTGLSKESLDKIPGIEVLLADPVFIAQVLVHPGNKSRWIQNTFAGLDAIVRALGTLEKPPEFLLTRQTEGFGQSMAEYVIGQIVARERNFPLMNDLQRASRFDYSQLTQYRRLNELNLGILGLGNIGTEVARQCKAVNMTVWAAVRDERLFTGQTSHQHVHYLRPMSKLPELLQEVDYLVSILPSTPGTRNLLSGDVLKPCAGKKTVFINIGRGDIIDDASLIHAVRSGWLGGAILDVFNTEPLPSESPLWTLPGVTITPHVSGITDTSTAVKTFVNNLIRYQNGQPLINQVDLTRGY
ncbi:unnamed protein product [Candidula unifasciata]|uniref:D-isomer specific 2-hydroxyacid dehydrogenase NAD-binding domain-containing protein n=1 Tax=Candidula unifasciata TaxID=100452 RepID=A0A8S3YUW0_9EUPU|nr:unnamed protein product [Candidula unifasciata]